MKIRLNTPKLVVFADSWTNVNPEDLIGRKFVVDVEALAKWEIRAGLPIPKITKCFTSEARSEIFGRGRLQATFVVLKLSKRKNSVWFNSAGETSPVHPFFEKCIGIQFIKLLPLESEMEKTEVLNSRAELISKLRDFVSDKWIMANILNLSDADIEKIVKIQGRKEARAVKSHPQRKESEMDDKRRHFDLWKREKLVELLIEKETNLEELQKRLDLETTSAARMHAKLTEFTASNLEYRKQVNLLAERLGQRESNTDFNNSLVMDSDDQLAAIAAKVTEEEKENHEYRMNWMDGQNHLDNVFMNNEHRFSVKGLKLEAKLEKSKTKAELAKAEADKVKYKYESASATAKWHRDRWIALYTSRTVQTGLRWIIGAATIVSGASLYLNI